ncbi:MAG: deoxyribonuclease IV [Elusimicrobiota bacterium]
MRIGAHCSISGGLYRSVERIIKAGGNTLQIFSGNPRGWKKSGLDQEDIKKFINLRKEKDIYPLVIHTPYLINIASPKKNLREKSIDALRVELKRASRLKADFLVHHPGNCGKESRKKGIQRVIQSLRKIFKSQTYYTQLLLENTAGQGNALGVDFDNLLKIRKSLNNRVNFCIDTAHAYQAGYTMDAILNHKIQKFTRVIHINDSKKEIGQNIDRHAHIGRGTIGLENFKKILNYPGWKNNPFILETPKENNMDVKNINTLKKLAEN